MGTILTFQIFSRYDGSGVRDARRDIDDLDNSTAKSTNSLNSWSGRIALATQAALTFGPALIPIGAAAIAAGAGLASMGTAVGAAGLAYGSTMKSVVDATEKVGKASIKAGDDLNRQKLVLGMMTPGTAEYAAQLKVVNSSQEEYSKQLKTLAPPQQNFIKASESMKGAMMGLGTSIPTKMLQTATTAIQGMTNIIKGMQPVILAIQPIVQGLADDFKKWTESPSLKHYIDLIKTNAVPALQKLIDIGKNVAHTLGVGFETFLPTGQKVLDVIKKGSDALAKWADGGGFKRFIDYVNQHKAAVETFFKNLNDALKNVGDAMGGLSGPSLVVTNALLKLVASAPPAVIQAIAIGFVAIKTAMQGIAIYEGLVAAFGAGSLAAAAATAIWSAAETALIATMIAFDVAVGPAIAIMLLIVIAVAAIAFGIYELVKHWDTVWSHIKGAAEAVGRWFSGPFVNFFIAAWSIIKQSWSDFTGKFVSTWNTVSKALQTAWNAVWNALKTAATTVWNALKTAWNAVVKAFQTAWTAVGTALKTAWTTVWNGLKTTVTTIWNALKTAWTTTLNALRTAWTTVGNALRTAWTTVWNAIKTAANTVWNWMKTAWTAVLNALKTAWTTVSNALKTAWQTVWNWMKTTAQTIWNALKTAWQTFLNGIKQIWETVSGALKTAWETVWNWIKDKAKEIWDAAKKLWQDFVDGVKKIWDTASGIIKKAWEDTWNWLKDTASKIWDGIKKVISDAVNFIIDVINGLIGAWNAVAGAVGLPTIGKIGHVGGGGGGGGGGGAMGGSSSSGTGPGGVPGFAEGGVMGFAGGGGVFGGYAPGVDSIPAMYSPGEGVLVPEAVRGLGADFVYGANHHFSNGRAGYKTGHFADGGIMGRMPFADGGVRGVPLRFAGGGFATEIPTPGGGTVGQTPGQNLSNTGKDTGPGNSLGALIPSIPGLPSIAEVTAKFMEWINKARGMSGFGKLNAMGGKVAGLGMQMLQKVIQAIQAKIAAMAKSVLSKIGGIVGGISGKVSNLSQIALNALKQAGIPASQLQNFLTRIQIESSGNPNAINNWDINAQRGTPSMGLAQITTTNFAKYGSGNILNPVDNLNASANYIKAVYGNTVPTGRAYAMGTPGANSGWAMVGDQGPEMVNFRGGEGVMNNHELAKAYRKDGDGGFSGDIHMPIHVAGNLDKAAVEKLDNEVIPKLRIMLSKGTGTRLR